MKTVGHVALLLALLFAADSSVAACTVFVAFEGKLALAGNNEDWGDPNTQMWFVPATKDNYGIVYFGFGQGSILTWASPTALQMCRQSLCPAGGLSVREPKK